MKVKSKITFFVMNKKGYSVLESVLKGIGPHVVDKVIGYTDNDVMNDYYKDIKELCCSYNINFFNKNEDFNIDTEYLFAIGWRWIIKNESKIIVLHDSLLPKYRGFAPLVNALVNGEKEIGVTSLFASSDYDEGDIIIQKKINISYPIKISKAIDIISHLYCDIVIELCKMILTSEHIRSFKQNNALATYSLWRANDDYFINWNDDSVKIRRFVDAVGFPYQGAKAVLDGKIIIIDEVEMLDDVKIENRDAGKVIFIRDGCPIVVCGKGLLKVSKARYEEANLDVFPLKNFRTKFE